MRTNEETAAPPNLICIPAQLAQRRLHWFGYDARRLEAELIQISFRICRLAQANWKPAKAVGPHAQERPGASLRKPVLADMA